MDTPITENKEINWFVSSEIPQYLVQIQRLLRVTISRLSIISDISKIQHQLSHAEHGTISSKFSEITGKIGLLGNLLIYADINFKKQSSSNSSSSSSSNINNTMSFKLLKDAYWDLHQFKEIYYLLVTLFEKVEGYLGVPSRDIESADYIFSQLLTDLTRVYTCLDYSDRIPDDIFCKKIQEQFTPQLPKDMLIHFYLSHGKLIILLLRVIPSNMPLNEARISSDRPIDENHIRIGSIILCDKSAYTVTHIWNGVCSFDFLDEIVLLVEMNLKLCQFVRDSLFTITNCVKN